MKPQEEGRVSWKGEKKRGGQWRIRGESSEGSWGEAKGRVLNGLLVDEGRTESNWITGMLVGRWGMQNGV